MVELVDSLEGVSLVSSQLLLVLALVSLAVAVIAMVRGIQLERRLKVVLTDSSGFGLERTLEEHFIERRDLMRRLADSEQEIARLNDLIRTTKRHLGVVRYDAFEDVGGSQSFALALYDEDGDGAVITSQVGRAECRVYCKPLSKGRADRTLSQEESRAVEEAYRRAPRPVINS